MSNTICVNDLDSWMTEDFVRRMFAANATEITKVKMERSRTPPYMPTGKAYVEFMSSQHAQAVIQNYNGKPIPEYSSKQYQLSWATPGAAAPIINTQGQVFSIFVGDLAPEVTDYHLESAFRPAYPSCLSAKVVTEAGTGAPKGYGFVRFGDETEQQRALREMNSMMLCGRPMRLSLATPKKTIGPQSSQPLTPQDMERAADPNNTTVFVGNLHMSVTSEQMRQHFQPFGDITTVKIPPGKSCGFVEFSTKGGAEMAIKTLNGKFIGPNAVRLSWGRSASKGRDGLSYTPMAYSGPSSYGSQQYGTARTYVPPVQQQPQQQQWGYYNAAAADYKYMDPYQTQQQPVAPQQPPQQPHASTLQTSTISPEETQDTGRRNTAYQAQHDRTVLQYGLLSRR